MSELFKAPKGIVEEQDYPKIEREYTQTITTDLQGPSIFHVTAATLLDRSAPNPFEI